MEKKYIYNIYSVLRNVLVQKNYLYWFFVYCTKDQSYMQNINIV